MTTTLVLIASLVSGLVAGFAFQRSRLCFVSALRDLYLFGATGMTRAMLTLLLATAAGGAILNRVRQRGALESWEFWGPPPEGALFGGLLFGIGMVLAGSCVAGAFWRLGEGQRSQLWVLGGVLAGTRLYLLFPVKRSALVQALLPWWLPIVAVGTVLALLVGWEHRQRYAGEEWEETKHRWSWRRPWAPEAGGVVLAGALTLFAGLTGSTWTVTRSFILDQSALLFSAGLLAGGYIAARIGHEYRQRPAGNWEQIALRFAGGLLMGYGARVGWGCTVGALMAGMVTVTVHPWWWLAGAVVGGGIGAYILRRFLMRLL